MDGAAEEGGAETSELGDFARRNGVTAEARLDPERVVKQIVWLPVEVEQDDGAVQLPDRRIDEGRSFRLDRLSLRPTLAEP